MVFVCIGPAIDSSAWWSNTKGANEGCLWFSSSDKRISSSIGSSIGGMIANLSCKEDASKTRK